MVSLIFIFLLGISTITLTENSQTVTQDFNLTPQDIKSGENNKKSTLQEIAKQIHQMPKEELAKIKKISQLIEEKGLIDNDPVDQKFLNWVAKKKGIFSKEEELKKWHEAWKNGVLVGMNKNEIEPTKDGDIVVKNEDENKIFSVINIGKVQYIIPSNQSYGMILKMKTIQETLATLQQEGKINIQKEEDINEDVFNKVFDRIAENIGADTLLYDMLAIRLFQKLTYKLQKDIFAAIK